MTHVNSAQRREAESLIAGMQTTCTVKRILPFCRSERFHTSRQTTEVPSRRAHVRAAQMFLRPPVKCDDSLSHLSFPLFIISCMHTSIIIANLFHCCSALPRLRSCLHTQLAGSPFYHLVPTPAKCRLQVPPEARSLKHVKVFTPFVYIASAGCCLYILGNRATVSEPKPGLALPREVLVKSTRIGITFAAKFVCRCQSEKKQQHLGRVIESLSF